MWSSACLHRQPLSALIKLTSSWIRRSGEGRNVGSLSGARPFFSAVLLLCPSSQLPWVMLLYCTSSSCYGLSILELWAKYSSPALRSTSQAFCSNSGKIEQYKWYWFCAFYRWIFMTICDGYFHPMWKPTENNWELCVSVNWGMSPLLLNLNHFCLKSRHYVLCEKYAT